MAESWKESKNEGRRNATRDLLAEAAHRAHAVASEAVQYGLGEIGEGAGPVHALGRVLEGVER